MTANARAGVVVIGAGGIGASVARTLRARGESVLVGFHHGPPPSGPDWARSIEVTEPDSCREFFAAAAKEAGRYRAVVTCFGQIAESPLARARGVDVKETFAVHVQGMLNVVQAAAFGLMKSRAGAVVNVGSVASRYAVPGIGAYAAAKAAVESCGRSLALELAAYGVTCNTVLPGFVDAGATSRRSDAWKEAVTRHVPLGRLVTADEVAALVAFLVSDEARAITGQSFVIDGGLSTGSPALLRDLAALAAREPKAAE